MLDKPDVQGPGGELVQELEVEDHELPGLDEQVQEDEDEHQEEVQWRNKLHFFNRVCFRRSFDSVWSFGLVP